MKNKLSLLFVIGTFFCLPALANQAKDNFTGYVEQLKRQALEDGISQKTIDEAFQHIHFMKKVISADKNQPEKKITLDQYLNLVLSKNKISDAAFMYQKYETQLAEIANRYAVPANYIVALWGLESSFGKVQGKDDVVSALATLAYDGRRESFFTRELIAALTIIDKGYVSADKLTGSWAGAMGQCQFMPSSYLKYGADGDNDGVIDIWYNHADVFASTANYLATEGWQVGLPWGNEVKLTKEITMDLTGITQEKGKTIAQWQDLGVEFENSLPHPDADQQAWLIMPDDKDGRAFLVYQNFRTIMHWNRSYYFAISVGMLADSLIKNETSQ